MSTQFDDLETLMSIALGDTDADAPCYPANVLDGHIRLVIMQLNDPTITESSLGSRQFGGDLTVLQQGRVIYRGCRSVISGTPDHFTYRTPLLSIVRDRGAQQLRSYFDQQITSLEGKLSVMTAMSELDEMVQSTLRYTLAYARSLAKVPVYTNTKI